MCSAHLGANSGPKAKVVLTYNQREWVSGPCQLWGGLDIARDKVPIALLVGVKYFRKDLYKDIKGQCDWNNVIFKRCKFLKRPNPMQLQQIIFILVCIKGELTNLKKRIIIVYICPYSMSIQSFTNDLFVLLAGLWSLEIIRVSYCLHLNASRSQT